MKKLDNYTAMGLTEGFIEGTEKEQIKAWQTLVNNGLAWKLQGRVGRTAMYLIKQGIIKQPKKLTSKNNIDYYGNTIFRETGK